MLRKYKKEEIVKGIINFIKESTEANLLSEVTSTEGRSKKKVVTLYTARALDNTDKKQITKKLEILVGCEIILKEIIDKSLLAGFRLKFEDWVYDASIKGQLENLKNQLYANI